jgi:hypothetical protein
MPEDEDEYDGRALKSSAASPDTSYYAKAS